MRALLLSVLVLSVLGALASGCTGVPYDSQRREGGASPNPLGLIAGDVLYVGPRPQCQWTEGSDPVAVAITGNVLLLLFDYDNPPPPTGSATTATGLFAMNGSALFNLSDCMPLEPTADDRASIMRSGRFEWPSIALAQGPPEADGSYGVRDYQIRGFFDNDGDFNPFYTVRNLATAGDVGGGALVDATAAIPIFRHVTFHHVNMEPEGERIEGVAVTLGAIIDTERPMFTVDDTTQALSSEATLPLIADPIAQEEALWQLSTMRLTLVRNNDQLDIDAMMGTRPWGPALAAAGIQYDFNPSVHGMPVQPVDADSNGFGDPHPILGGNGVNWFTPIVLMQRARNPIEVSLGMPDVLLIGSVRPTVVGGVSQGFVQRETFSAADVLVPPVGVIVTDPLQPILCRVPYIPPGNPAEIYQTQRSECQELPTGNYDVNILAGVAGARVIDVAADCVARCVAGGTAAADCMPGCRLSATLRTDTGFVYQGGQYSSQAWSVPNELGCPDLDYHPAAINQLDQRDSHGHFLQCAAQDVPDAMSVLLSSQSRHGSFAIVDPDGSNAPTAADQVSSPVDGRGVTSCVSALHTAGPMAGMVGPVDRSMQPHVPPQCCAPIRHLCGLPLCPLRDATTLPGYPEGVRASGTSRQTREMRVEGVDYTVGGEGAVRCQANVDCESGHICAGGSCRVVTPLCVPFMMPVDCCFAATM